MSEEKALKNKINPDLVQKYSEYLQKNCEKFSPSQFHQFTKKINDYELKKRIQTIASALHESIDLDYSNTIDILITMVHELSLSGFEVWPISDYIEKFGFSNLKKSFKSMSEITKVFTAEFCARPYILEYPKESYDFLLKMSQSSNLHHRRWASEATRPRLPWGMKLHELIKNPAPNFAILDHLKFDPELYVRKSVSNHLNDISKDHPIIVIKILKKWSKLVPKSFENEFSFILNRSLRTLIKKGDPDALKLVGIEKNLELKIKNFYISSQIIDSKNPLEFSLEIENQSQKTISFLLDYAIYFQKKNGQKNKKVFKLKKNSLAAKEKIKIFKKHSFRPITTQKYYPGEHEIECILNGNSSKKLNFQYFK